MSRAISAHHGAFGRACIYELNRPMAMHAHREGHMIFHVSGPEQHCQVAGVQHSISQDRAVAVSPWLPHDFSMEPCAKATVVLVLYIDPSWFQTASGAMDGNLRFGQSAIPVSKTLREKLHCVVDLLAKAENGVDLDEQLHTLTQECHDLSWRHSDERMRPLGDQHMTRDHRIRKSIKLMKNRVGDIVKLDDIASEAGLSRPHFYRLFRENLGITPNVYLNTLRMELAIDRLVSTNQAVTSIGLDLGFASQASFTRFFGANVGIPPTDYRRVAHCA